MKTATRTATLDSALLYQYILFIFAVAALYLLCAIPAYAAAGMCGLITSNLNTPGGFGPAIASIGVIMIGIGAALGRVSWGMAVLVAVGISVIFGYTSIVTSLGGTACS